MKRALMIASFLLLCSSLRAGLFSFLGSAQKNTTSSEEDFNVDTSNQRHFSGNSYGNGSYRNQRAYYFGPGYYYGSHCYYHGPGYYYGPYCGTGNPAASYRQSGKDDRYLGHCRYSRN